LKSVVAPTSDYATVTADNVSSLAPTVFGKFTGTWSSGNLFTITPDAAYTGDLVVRVYIVNTGQLIRTYEHLNMSVEFVGSDNSTMVDEQGIAQVLNLQNSEVLFTWANGTGTSPYHARLDGGSYRLLPFKSLSGASYQPQLWIEITQR